MVKEYTCGIKKDLYCNDIDICIGNILTINSWAFLF